MLIDFKELAEVTIPKLNGGEGAVSARMYMDAMGKVMLSYLPVGASIGMHRHEGSCELNYAISGSGYAMCHGIKETLCPGVCQYCPDGSEHSIVNTGDEELVMFTVVPKYK